MTQTRFRLASATALAVAAWLAASTLARAHVGEEHAASASTGLAGLDLLAVLALAAAVGVASWLANRPVRSRTRPPRTGGPQPSPRPDADRP